jgi:hypothetical protein
MAKEIIIDVTVPAGLKAGDTFQYVYVKPTRVVKSIEEMSELELYKRIKSLKSTKSKMVKNGVDTTDIDSKIAAAENMFSTKFKA